LREFKPRRIENGNFFSKHPRADEPIAPFFPAMKLTVPKPTGVGT
jgi:hypothetical protein